MESIKPFRYPDIFIASITLLAMLALALVLTIKTTPETQAKETALTQEVMKKAVGAVLVFELNANPNLDYAIYEFPDTFFLRVEFSDPKTGEILFTRFYNTGTGEVSVPEEIPEESVNSDGG